MEPSAKTDKPRTRETSTVTSKGQTTVPKGIREALNLEPGTTLRWEVSGRTARVFTFEESPLAKWRGAFKVGPGDVLADIEKSRKMRGREE